jgi:hypothetical protein
MNIGLLIYNLKTHLNKWRKEKEEEEIKEEEEEDKAIQVYRELLYHLLKGE